MARGRLRKESRLAASASGDPKKRCPEFYRTDLLLKLLAKVDIQDTKRACGLVSSNLTELSFENKRLTFESLGVKAWLNREEITIEGAIPITDSVIVSSIW